jgi:hypothetical protein
VELLKVGLLPVQGCTMIGLMYGVDNQTWTVVDYPTNGRYSAWTRDNHSLDLIELWTPLKAVT